MNESAADGDVSDPGSAPAAIVLAGGRGSRLGGLSKADLEIDGRRLLDRVLDAVDTCTPRVVVAPANTQVPPDVLLTREDPPLSGPAAALAAGLTCLEASGHQPEWVMVLACDIPGVADATPALIDAANTAAEETDAVSASPDATDRIQWLVSIVRIAALHRAIDRLGPGGVVNCSMGRLLGGLRWDRTRVPAESCDDIDTWEDHAAWLSTHRTT